MGVLLTQAETLSDTEVVDRVLGGETGVYELLMRRYNQRLFRVIRSVIPNDLRAEDVLQETWVRAYEHLGQFAGRSTFATWVTRIAFHEALARVRKSRRWMPMENDRGDIVPDVSRQSTEDTPEALAIRGQLRTVLGAAIDALPEGYRSVFVLREVEQLSTGETAECLGVSEEAVKTRLHRSRALLRRELTVRMGPAIAGTYTFLGQRCDRTVSRVLTRIVTAGGAGV